jgi:hypothetical protein
LYFDRETVNDKRIREQDLGRVEPRISHPTPVTGTCPFSSWGPESGRAAMTKRSNPTTLRRR